MQKKPIENNSWYFYNDNSDTALVFVHGFFSSSQACWTNTKANSFWPDIVLNDKRVPPTSIYLGGYFTDVDSGAYGVRECSKELFDSLKRPSELNEKSPIEFKNIIFICHSLGGIVTRYMLECFRESFHDQKIGLILMASPSIGSDYANKLTKVASFYRNRAALQLKINSELLSDLDGRFKKFLTSRKPESFLGVEAIEHVSFLHCRWLPGFEPIVAAHSASRYFADHKIIPKSNHSSIVKPADNKHQSHILLIDFLRDFFSKAGSPPRPNGPSIASHIIRSVQGPLFDIYEPNCEPYYLVRAIDNQIAVDFNYSSFWLYGPSGAGKTSIIKRLLANAGSQAIEICLSQCTSNDFRDSFISEMVETLHLLEHESEPIPERTLRNLIRMISGGISQKKYLFIYIDEVPSIKGAESAEGELLKIIETILTSVKQTSEANSFRIIVSSLGQPDLAESNNPSKMHDYLRVIHCPAWNKEEIIELIELISPGLDQNIANDLPQGFAELAQGSPRFIKTFFKTKISQPHKTNDELLRLTTHGFQF